MPVRITRLALLVLVLAWPAAGPALAADIDIVSIQYTQNFKPGDTITFTTRARNNTPSSVTLYVDHVLTNRATGAETEVVSGAAAVASGATGTFTASTTAAAGAFTVTVIVFDGGDVERVRTSGPVLITVGTPVQELSTFPNVFNFGTIPLGRNMHPQPIKVNYDFFLFNRLGLGQPFFIRIYTDNASRYRGIPGAIYPGSPAGLVSSDGLYTIPLKVWTLNYGPATSDTGWNPAIMGPPLVEDDTAWQGPILNDGTHDTGRVAWQRVPDYSEMTANNDTWRLLIGQDPYDTENVIDSNQSGDFTLTSPFDVYLATEAGASSVRGEYHTRIVIELFTP